MPGDILEYLSPKRKAEHSLDRLDVFDLQTADRLSETEMARQALEPAGEEYPPALRLYQDALLGLYKAVPRQKPAEQVTASHRLNHAVVSKAMDLRPFEELRLRTRLDPALSMLGALNLWEQLVALLTEEQKEAARQAAQQEQEAADCEKQAGAALAMAEAAAQAGNQEQASQRAETAMQQAANLQQQAQQAQQEAEAVMQQALADVPDERTIARAVRQAAQETGEQAQSLDGWGLDPGALQRVPPEERLALAERVMKSQKLQRLAQLVGRFCNLAIAAQAEKTERVPGQIEGIELGGDLSRVLPAEMALLHHRMLRRDFYRRLVEGQLMQYKMTGRRKQALGPLVTCHDESSSMRGPKELWSKAVILALLFIARRQKRPFASIAFGSTGQIRVKIVERPEQATMADVLEIAEPFFNGGTDFQSPLTEAMRIIEGAADTCRFKRADVVFSTDGICRIKSDFLAEFQAFKERTGTRVFAVLTDVGQSAEYSVRTWSDRVYRVLDLAHDTQAAAEAAKAVFGAV